MFVVVLMSMAQVSCSQNPAAPENSTTANSHSQADTPLENTNSAGIVFAGATTTASDWPQWRGPKRDGRSPETGLMQTWPTGGPKLLWTYREAGLGFGQPAVADGTIYLLGSEKESAFAMALDAANGTERWRRDLGKVFTNNWGDGPRSTPTVDGDRLYVLTGVGDMACLDRATGEIRWKKSLTKDFGGRVPSWGYCESPLVDGDRVLATPGGKKFLVALNKNTGDTLMTSSGLSDGAQYSSPISMTFAGKPMYVTMSQRGAVGLDAKTGALWWRCEDTGNGTAVIPTPIAYNEYVYTTSGYGAGCALVKLQEGENGTINAENLYANKLMSNQHGGVILLNGHLYGYSDGPGWLCQDLLTGKEKWRERRKLGKGCISYADQRFYCYSERGGTVVLLAADSARWSEQGRFDIPEQTQYERKAGQIWAHPVIARGCLYLRDQELLFCYDIKTR